MSVLVTTALILAALYVAAALVIIAVKLPEIRILLVVVPSLLFLGWLFCS